jgi:hypothetical protein
MPGLKPLFSQRHREALFVTKTLKLSFFQSLRVGMERILQQYSDGSGLDNWTYERAHDRLCTVRGSESLVCPRRPVSSGGFLHRVHAEGLPDRHARRR